MPSEVNKNSVTRLLYIDPIYFKKVINTCAMNRISRLFMYVFWRHFRDSDPW